MCNAGVYSEPVGLFLHVVKIIHEQESAAFINVNFYLSS